MKTKTPTYITTAALLLLGALSPRAFGASITIDQANETGPAWIAQARAAEHNQDFQHALDLFQRASILPGTEEAGTVGYAHVQQLMGDAELAQETLLKFLERINPFSLDAHLALVDAYVAQDKQANAEHELQVVQKLRPGYGPANERIGVIAFRKGNFRVAVSSLTKVLERNPSHLRALELRARTYLKLEKYSSALADYKQLQTLEPDEIEHYVSIGRIYMQLGELDVAERYLSEALAATEVSPAQRVRILVLAGNLEQTKGNDKKALAFFKKAYETNPRDLELGLKLTDIYASSHNFPQAQLTLDRVMEFSPGNDSAVKLALKISDLYVNTKSYAQAQQTLARVMEASPGNEAAARRMVELYQLLGRHDGLGVFLKNYINSYPEKTWALLSYTHLLLEIGDAPGAENALRSAGGKNGFPNPEVALALVKLLSSQKRFEDVQAALQKALDKFPKDDRLHFDLALCWENLAEPKKAIREYEKVGVSRPDVHQRAFVNLALLYEKNGDTEKAVAALKTVEVSGPLATLVQLKINELSRTFGPGATRSPASEH